MSASAVADVESSSYPDRVKHFMMNCWKENLYEQLYASCFPERVTNLPTITRSSSKKKPGPKKLSFAEAVPSLPPPQVIHNLDMLMVMYISKIGVLLWSSKYSGTEDEKVVDNTARIGSSVNAVETVDDPSIPVISTSQRNRRKVAVATTPFGNPIAKHLVKDFVLNCLDPHGLITPYRYREPLGPAPDEDQPFKVVVHPQVALVCDVHSHLSEAEVIGFLAGKWDASEQIIYIQAAIPCTSTVRDLDNGSTDVELDAEAEWKAREVVTELGLQIVGWYHSHPRFRPNPSPIDIENQLQYQMLMKREDSDVAPFVGLIVSTFDKSNNEKTAQHSWFAVKSFRDDEAPHYEAGLPIEINVSYMTLNNNFAQEYDIKESFKSRFASLQTTCKISIKYSMVVDADICPTSLGTSNDEGSVCITTILNSDEGEFDGNVCDFGERRSRRVTKPKDIYDDSKYRKAKRSKQLGDLKLGPGFLLQSNIVSVEPCLTKNAEVSSETDSELYGSLIVTAQDQDISSSILAKQLLCSSPMHLRYVAQILVSLIIYYSRHVRRVDLLGKWKGSNKLEKLDCSAQRWLNLFRNFDGSALDSCMVQLFAGVRSLLIQAWDDYSKKTGKLKYCKRKLTSPIT